MRISGGWMGMKPAMLFCFWALFPLGVSGQTLLGPSVYTSFANSPFSGGSFSYFHLETFEGGSLSVPGVTASTGAVVGPGALVDSVDADDGTIDGLGQNGRSFFSAGGPQGIRFTFSSAVLGQLPTHVGLVWTDGNNNIRFEAFDALNNSIGLLTGNHADGSFTGTTGEDRFYGIIHSGGIGSILMQSGLPTNGGGIEVDHLQYGVAAAIPEPSTLILSSSAVVIGALLLRKRLRRKGAKGSVKRFAKKRWLGIAS